MRALTGRDEILFAERQGPVTGLVALMVRLGLAPEPALRAMPLPAWEERLLDLRTRLIGPRIEAELTCPACGADALLLFNAGDLPREAPSPAAGPLPLRPLTAGDLADLEAAAMTGDTALAFLLARAADIAVLEAEARLAGDDGRALTAALETAVSGLALDLATTCTDCAAPITAPFDIADFLAAELAARARRLLDEIHLVAMAYHWSEAEILDLPFGRRQDYIARILADRTVSGRVGAAA